MKFRRDSKQIGRISMLLMATAGISLAWESRVVADTDTWLGTTGGNWTDGSKWSSTAPPAAGQDASITSAIAGTQTIIYDYSGFSITLNSLVIDTTGGGINTLSMAANTLNVSGNEFVGGANGQGNLVQSGGTNALTGANSILHVDVPFLGSPPIGTSTYSLSGGLLNAAALEYIGQNGPGIFNQSAGVNTAQAEFLGAVTTGSGYGIYNQSGGANIVVTSGATNRGLQIGGLYFGATSTYTLSAGSLTVQQGAGAEKIGSGGSHPGIFDQSGGTNTAFSLQVGASGGSGTYLLKPGGILTILPDGLETVPASGAGTFIQTGGSHIIGDSATFTIGSGSTGSYTLSNGSLAVGAGINEIIGRGGSLGTAGSGTFNQSGGTHTLAGGSTLQLGIAVASGLSRTAGIGTYNLGNGANLQVAGSEYIGYSSQGVFNQSGGTNALTSGGNLYIAFSQATDGLAAPTFSTGTYTLSGGQLSVDGNAYIGGDANTPGGTGTLTVLGNAQVNIAGHLQIWDQPPSKLSLQGGTTTAGNATNLGAIQQTGGVANLGALSGTGSVSVGNLAGGNSASMELSALTQSSLLLDATGSLVLTGGAVNNTLHTLQINPGGLLDSRMTSMTISYGSGPSPNAAIASYLSSAYNGASGPWTGTTGITSANAATDSAHHTVAFADGSDGVIKNLPAGVSSAIPAGGQLPAGSELITYAFVGDANLDGKVDELDFAIIAGQLGQQPIIFATVNPNWDQGNFNYSPNIDATDFMLLANNLGDGISGGNGDWFSKSQLDNFNTLANNLGFNSSQIATWDAQISNLPEPAGAGFLLISMTALMRRSTRKRARSSSTIH